MTHGRWKFVFDVPSGIFKSAMLTEELSTKALKPGPVLDMYGCVLLRTSLDLMEHDDPALKVLVYQRRWIDQKFFPRVCPELRAAMPVDFGRSRRIAWYHPVFEQNIVQEFYPLPDIDPEDVL